MPNSPTLQIALQSTVSAQRKVRHPLNAPEVYLPPQARAPLPDDPTPRVAMPGEVRNLGGSHRPLGNTRQEIGQ
jgi:hypothetical protein